MEFIIKQDVIRCRKWVLLLNLKLWCYFKPSPDCWLHLKRANLTVLSPRLWTRHLSVAMSPVTTLIFLMGLISKYGPFCDNSGTLSPSIMILSIAYLPVVIKWLVWLTMNELFDSMLLTVVTNFLSCMAFCVEFVTSTSTFSIGVGGTEKLVYNRRSVCLVIRNLPRWRWWQSGTKTPSEGSSHDLWRIL